MLSIACSDRQRTWDLQLPLLMMAYRTSVQETTGETPFSLMFGREAKLPVDIMFGQTPDQKLSTNEYVLGLQSRLEASYQLVRNRLKLSQKRQKNHYDQRSRGNPFETGDLVWIHMPAVPRGKSPKFHCPWSGPYIVKKKINDVLYRVKNVRNPRKTTVVHFDRLKPCYTEPSTLNSPTNNTEKNGHTEDPSSDVVLQDESDPPIDYDDYDDYVSGIGDDGTDRDETATEEINQPLRRSTRISRPPERYGDFVTHSLS